VLDLDALGLTARELLRERAPELIAHTCAWSVGLSDQPHYELKDGRLAPSGLTLGARAELGQSFATEALGRLELGDALPGSFKDALNSQARDGRLYVELLDDEVLRGFARATGVLALEGLREAAPDDMAELLDDAGSDGKDLAAVVRILEWEEVLRADAEELVLAALGDAPLLDVETEGAPLSVVTAAERLTAQAAAPTAEESGSDPDEGVMFLAEAAIDRSGLQRPVPPDAARPLLVALLQEGLELDEIRQALPHLPVLADTADVVNELLDQQA
jgi:hypothetical protein